MSLCHGPGCRRPQTVPFWCSEECQRRWDARWGKRLPGELYSRFVVFHVCACGRPIYRHRADRTPERRTCGICLLREANREHERRQASQGFLMAAVEEARPQVVEEIKNALDRAVRVAPTAALGGPVGRWLGRMFGKDHT